MLASRAGRSARRLSRILFTPAPTKTRASRSVSSVLSSRDDGREVDAVLGHAVDAAEGAPLGQRDS